MGLTDLSSLDPDRIALREFMCSSRQSDDSYFVRPANLAMQGLIHFGVCPFRRSVLHNQGRLLMTRRILYLNEDMILSKGWIVKGVLCFETNFLPNSLFLFVIPYENRLSDLFSCLRDEPVLYVRSVRRWFAVLNAGVFRYATGKDRRAVCPMMARWP